MRGGLPNTAVETREYWKDLRAIHSTIMFDRIILISREAATAKQNQCVTVSLPFDALLEDPVDCNISFPLSKLL